jgi:hypothetical protein
VLQTSKSLKNMNKTILRFLIEVKGVVSLMQKTQNDNRLGKAHRDVK